jgi:iron-sulfur cluster assembly protein
LGEEEMIEVTARATQLMKAHFKKKPKSPIRIYVSVGGCGIRTFGVALETPKKNDEVFKIDGFTYIINRKLLEKVKPIRVDSDGVGFRLTGTGIQTQGGCGSCGYMCGVTSGDRCSGDCDNCELKCVHGRIKAKTVKKVSAKKPTDRNR